MSETMSGISPAEQQLHVAQPEQLAVPEHNPWKETSIGKKLESQAGNRFKAGLLTDIDGTFQLRDSDSQTDSDLNDAMHQLAAHLDAKGYPKVAVTGRQTEQMLEPLQHGWLPHFDVLLPVMGTERLIRIGENYEYDHTYEAKLRDEHGFIRQTVYAALLDFQSHMRERSIELSFRDNDIPENVSAWNRYDDDQSMHIQPKMNRPANFQIGMYYTGDAESIPAMKTELNAFLAEKGLERVKSVLVAQIPQDGRVFIDVVAILKDEATKLLIDELAEQYGETFWAYAGDSPNDAAPLKNTGDVGLMVGGARPDLQTELATLNSGRAGKRFTLISPDDSGKQRIIYQEKTAKRGPQSLQRAIRGCELLLHLAHRTDTNTTESESTPTS